MNASPLRRVAALVAGLTVAGTLLAACASGTSTSSGDAKPGELTVAGPYQITGLDPQGSLAADNGTQLAAKQIFSSLVSRDGANFKPNLATKWTPSADGKSWVFDLRPGVKYSDGTAFAASDVVASVARVVQLKGTLASLWANITVTPGDNQVTFTSTAPQGALLSKLSTLSILPAAKVAGADFFTKPIGTGPFQVDSFAPGQSLTLVPNPNYFGDKPKLAKLTIRYISATAARVTALKTGEIQATWSLPDDQMSQLTGQSDLTVKTVSSDAQYTMWFNSGLPAFANAKVRTALWQAVDFATIIKALYPTTGTAAQAPIASTIVGFAKQSPVAYNADAAKAALTAAGFDFAKTYQLAYSGQEFSQFAQAVAADFAKIGVKVAPTSKEKSVYLSDLLAMKWDINLQSLGDATGDADYVLGRLYTCAAKRTGYCNPALDTLLAGAAATGDATERASKYAQAEQIIWSDAVGMYPMDVQISYVWRSNIKGFTPSSNYQPDLSVVSVA